MAGIVSTIMVTFYDYSAYRQFMASVYGVLAGENKYTVCWISHSW